MIVVGRQVALESFAVAELDDDDDIRRANCSR